MAASTGWVLAAGAIEAVNEAVFVPAETGKAPDFTSVWKILPAAGLLAVGLAFLEKAVPEFAVGMAKLLVVAVLVFPVGNAPTPLQNAAKLVSKTGQIAANPRV
jgi:hypothetical protein